MLKRNSSRGACAGLWAGIGVAVLLGVGALGPSAAGQVTTTTTTTTTRTTTTSTTAPPVQVIVPPVRPRPPHWRPPHPEWPATVALTAVNVTVTIEEQVAATSVEMVLHNPAGRAQEAEVMLPVPDGVAVRSFEYDGVGPEPTARLLPKDEARRIYESIVNRERDPGLLEFVGYSMIRSSVFPVPPGGERRARLVYEQVLGLDGRRVDYALPRSETGAGAGGTPVPAGAPLWTIGVTIRSKQGISTVYSPSHEIVTERIGPGQVAVRVPGQYTSAPGPFRLSYLVEPAGNGVSATVLAYPDPGMSEVGGGYFLLLAGLPAAPARERAVKREVVLVLDRSGSMRGEKMEQARQAALQVVEGLEMGEAFNIIDFSDTIATFAERPVIKTAETAGAARAYIRSLQAGGGTAIHDALTEALRPAPTEGMLPIVLFLTDGLPTIGERSEARIREDARRMNGAGRRIFTFGVGFDVNGPLLTGIARGSRAAATFVLPQEDVEVKVSQVFRRLSGPVLARPRLSAEGAGGGAGSRIREVQAGSGGAEIQDLFDGDQLVVLGQYTGAAPIRLRLEGEYLGAPRTFEYEFDPRTATARNAYVARLWASRKIASLLDEIRQNSAGGGLPPANDPKSKELIEEIVRLSLKHGILTEYTAFLATEPGVAVAGEGGRWRDIAPPPPAAAAPMRARAEMQKLAADRAGQAGVAQDMNVQQQVESKTLAMQNCYVGADLNVVRLTGVQQVNDVACFNRAGRWVDSRILDKEGEKPDREVEFGTEEYFKVVEALAKENRQGMLALGGECLLLVGNERVLVKGP